MGLRRTMRWVWGAAPTVTAAASKLGGPKRTRASLEKPNGSVGTPTGLVPEPAVAVQVLKGGDGVAAGGQAGQRAGGDRVRSGPASGSAPDRGCGGSRRRSGRPPPRSARRRAASPAQERDAAARLTGRRERGRGNEQGEGEDDLHSGRVSWSHRSDPTMMTKRAPIAMTQTPVSLPRRDAPQTPVARPDARGGCEGDGGGRAAGDQRRLRRLSARPCGGLRLAYWIPVMWGGALWGHLCSRLVERWIDLDERPWLTVAVLDGGDHRPGGADGLADHRAGVRRGPLSGFDPAADARTRS